MGLLSIFCSRQSNKPQGAVNIKTIQQREHQYLRNLDETTTIFYGLAYHHQSTTAWNIASLLYLNSLNAYEQM